MLIADQYLVIVLHAPTFCLIALPMVQLEHNWSRSPHHNEWKVNIYDPYSITNSPNDSQCSLPLDNYGLADGPWVLALHTFKPTWRGTDAPVEIYVVAYGRVENRMWTKCLLTYNIQLLPGTDAGIMATGQRLKLVKQSFAPAETVPWNSDCITNNGRMFAQRAQLLGFSLFSDLPQPCNSIDLGIRVNPDEEPTIASVEPYSGAMAVGTPGRVRIIYFK